MNSLSISASSEITGHASIMRKLYGTNVGLLMMHVCFFYFVLETWSAVIVEDKTEDQITVLLKTGNQLLSYMRMASHNYLLYL